MTLIRSCPGSASAPAEPVSRRDFIQAVGVTAAAATSMAGLPGALGADDAAVKVPAPESLVKKLYDSLAPAQREEICFPWDYQDDRGLLRTRVQNNWHVTAEDYVVGGKFFTADQQELIREIFFAMYQPEWREKILKQLKDDAGGYGLHQTIAIFGAPGTDQFEFVMTGRHLTIRCDGNSAEKVAFGGPIFYGHAASGFNEQVGHPGNIFWHQALKANALYQMLDGKQRAVALIDQAPGESSVGFRGRDQQLPGVRVSELSRDQKEHAQEVLKVLLEPYRQSDQAEVVKCLEAQGGLDQCALSFYKSGDLGNDEVWDIWRLEGPAFVWHFRGTPHVHVWVNVASDSDVALNAQG